MVNPITHISQLRFGQGYVPPEDDTSLPPEVMMDGRHTAARSESPIDEIMGGRFAMSPDLMDEHGVITDQIQKIVSLAREQFIEIRTAIVQGREPNYTVLNKCSDDLLRLIYLIVPVEKREGMPISYFHGMIPTEITEKPTADQLTRCQSLYEKIEEFKQNPQA